MVRAGFDRVALAMANGPGLQVAPNILNAFSIPGTRTASTAPTDCLVACIWGRVAGEAPARVTGLPVPNDPLDVASPSRCCLSPAPAAARRPASPAVGAAPARPVVSRVARRLSASFALTAVRSRSSGSRCSWSPSRRIGLIGYEPQPCSN